MNRARDRWYATTVMNWLPRLFSRNSKSPEAIRSSERVSGAAPVSEPSSELGSSAATDEPPAWVSGLADAVQKVNRAQAKTSARIEALEAKLEGGFADLRASYASAQPAAMPASKLGSVLDALDVLDEARRVLVADGSTRAEQGLAGVTERLERFLGECGVLRRAVVTEPLDGRLFRVVGTVSRDDLPDGITAQVVRAAALTNDQVVREGQVLVNRKVSQ